MVSSISSCSSHRSSINDFFSHRTLPPISSSSANWNPRKPCIISLPSPNGFRVDAEEYANWLARARYIKAIDEIEMPEPDWIEFNDRSGNSSFNYNYVVLDSEDYYSQAGFILKETAMKRIWTFPDQKPQEKEISEKPQVQLQADSKPDEKSQTKPCDFLSVWLEKIKRPKSEFHEIKSADLKLLANAKKLPVISLKSKGFD
jgi:hypothetical protein